MGLSSIATLSLGLSMSMAGAGRAVIRSLGPGHRQALEQFFPVVPPPTSALAQLTESKEESTESINHMKMNCKSNPRSRRTITEWTMSRTLMSVRQYTTLRKNSGAL